LGWKGAAPVELNSDQFAKALYRALVDYSQVNYLDLVEEGIHDFVDLTLEGSVITAVVDTVPGGNSQRFEIIVRG
jgi:hypothetical protein